MERTNIIDLAPLQQAAISASQVDGAAGPVGGAVVGAVLAGAVAFVSVLSCINPGRAVGSLPRFLLPSVNVTGSPSGVNSRGR